jgi:hypothetical protein
VVCPTLLGEPGLVLQRDRFRSYMSIEVVYSPRVISYSIVNAAKNGNA